MKTLNIATYPTIEKALAEVIPVNIDAIKNYLQSYLNKTIKFNEIIRGIN